MRFIAANGQPSTERMGHAARAESESKVAWAPVTTILLEASLLPAADADTLKSLQVHTYPGRVRMDRCELLWETPSKTEPEGSPRSLKRRHNYLLAMLG